VEITETLQHQMVVGANSADEALAAVEDDYRSSDIILDADNFVGVDFQVIDVVNFKTGVK
jgi:hypothetical protein